MKRIMLIGKSGCGKTTFCQKIFAENYLYAFRYIIIILPCKSHIKIFALCNFRFTNCIYFYKLVGNFSLSA